MDTRKLSDERLSQLGKYFKLKDAVDELVRIVKSAPNDEYKQAESSLLMVHVSICGVLVLLRLKLQ